MTGGGLDVDPLAEGDVTWSEEVASPCRLPCLESIPCAIVVVDGVWLGNMCRVLKVIR